MYNYCLILGSVLRCSIDGEIEDGAGEDEVPHGLIGEIVMRDETDNPGGFWYITFKIRIKS